jgi:UDP-glucose 4-epimerase
VLGLGRGSRPEADWPGAYRKVELTTDDLTHLAGDFAPDAVLHAAGAASVAESFTDPQRDFRASLLTWHNLLDGVRRSRVRPRVLFPSSAAVYGNATSLPIAETAPVLPISPYGFHKAACELLAREYSDCFGLNVVVCRLFSTFGSRQRRLLVWELFQKLSQADDEVWLEGTGAETRDYLSVEDVASVLLRLAGDSELDSGCRVVNVASGRAIRVDDLAHHVSALTNCSRPIRYHQRQRTGDPRLGQADIARLRTLMPDWNPTPIEQALSHCISVWHQ